MISSDADQIIWLAEHIEKERTLQKMNEGARFIIHVIKIKIKFGNFGKNKITNEKEILLNLTNKSEN